MSGDMFGLPTAPGKEDQVRDMGLIVAGKDRLACDVVGSYLLGYDAARALRLVETIKSMLRAFMAAASSDS